MRSWPRFLTLAAFIAIAAIALFAAFDRHRSGTIAMDFSLENAAANRTFVVTRAATGSSLRVGDHFTIDDASQLAAMQYRALPAGSTLVVRRTLPLPEQIARIPVRPDTRENFRVTLIPIELMFLGVAFVIAARGRSSGSLSLAWLFALLVLLVDPVTPSWPAAAMLTFAALSAALVVMVLFCATDFATRFGGDPSARWARRLRRISLSIAITGVVLAVASGIENFVSVSTPPVLGWTIAVVFIAQAICFLAGLSIAFRLAQQADRQRIAWVAASLGIGVVAFTVSLVAATFNANEALRNYPLLLMIAMPLGCAYAILRYRLLDIAFVVNRAAVFGVTSLLVLGALALVDYGLQTLLGSWLLRTGIYVQLGLALTIGIATRPIHERVDSVVDDVFFRRRHEAERTLRQFARDVAHIDSSAVVLQRTVDTIARTVGLRCAVLVPEVDGLHDVAHSEAAAYTDLLERNDGAVVRLLATREPVDLHDVETAVRGDFAFPMFARNRLIGMLVCGRDSGSSTVYAPDEIDAIGAVAQASGIALDLLRIENLEREVASLRGGVARDPALRPM
jgi:hypothetical protein